MANTSGEKELKTDYPTIDKTPYNLIPQEINLVSEDERELL